MKLTDRIIHELMLWCRSSAYDIILPNFYVGSYEMDVFRLLTSGYIIEYEVKISRSDFKADFEKGWDSYNGTKHRKHDDLISGTRGCNRFFYVVPFQMVLPEDVPAYAGLIYWREGKFTLVKNAKLLHKNQKSMYKDLAIKLAFRDELKRQKIRSLKREYDALLKEHNELKKAHQRQIATLK